MHDERNWSFRIRTGWDLKMFVQFVLHVYDWRRRRSKTTITERLRSKMVIRDGDDQRWRRFSMMEMIFNDGYDSQWWRWFSMMEIIDDDYWWWWLWNLWWSRMVNGYWLLLIYDGNNDLWYRVISPNCRIIKHCISGNKWLYWKKKIPHCCKFMDVYFLMRKNTLRL